MTTTLDLDALHYKQNSNSQYLQAYNLLKDIKLSPEASILDIGCGHGHIIGELSKVAPFGSCIGIDPSPNMISLASEMFPKRMFNNLEFRQLKAEEMNFQPESFDLVVCTNAFMWIRDPRKVLRLISKFLKPNGLFVLFSYSKETPYARLFEEVLEVNFPELKNASAASTMLTTDQYSELLKKNRLKLSVFKIEDVIFEYENEHVFMNYVLGWLSCYAPLDTHQQEIFLNKLIEASKKFRKEQNAPLISIPHKTISIRASKLSSSRQKIH
ncbi:MAG: methyltransferase domain-containing protein [Chlamydiota bacterium]